MKKEPPQLEMEDVIDIKSLSREELKKVPGEPWKWYCGVEGCHHYTTVISYGDGPMWAPNVQGGVWMDIMKEFFICGPHNRKYRFQMSALPEKKGPWINNISKTINHPEFPDK